MSRTGAAPWGKEALPGRKEVLQPSQSGGSGNPRERALLGAGSIRRHVSQGGAWELVQRATGPECQNGLPAHSQPEPLPAGQSVTGSDRTVSPAVRRQEEDLCRAPGAGRHSLNLERLVPEATAGVLQPHDTHSASTAHTGRHLVHCVHSTHGAHTQHAVM